MTVQVGSRIRLLQMDNDPYPIPVGTEGTITGVFEKQISVDWADGRSLMLIPEDRFEVIE